MNSSDKPLPVNTHTPDHPYEAVTRHIRRNSFCLITTTILIMTLTASAQAQTADGGSGTTSPSSSKHLPLTEDHVWGQPLRYIDVVLMQAEEKIRPIIEHFSQSDNNGMFILPSPIRRLSGTVSAFLNAESGRAVIRMDITIQKAINSPKESCNLFFLLAGNQLGLKSPQWARDNQLSHLLPPTAGLIDRDVRSAANDRLLEQLDLAVQIYELETHRLFTCIKPALTEEFSVLIEDSLSRGSRPTK